MNKEQQQIIDEAFKNYLFTSEWLPISGVGGGFIGTKANSDEIMTQDLFINKIKTDNEFSEKWGLKIEERKLNLEERGEWDSKKNNVRNTWGQVIQTFTPKEVRTWLNEKNVPTKLITVTYNENTIESCVL